MDDSTSPMDLHVAFADRMTNMFLPKNEVKNKSWKTEECAAQCATTECTTTKKASCGSGIVSDVIIGECTIAKKKTHVDWNRTLDVDQNQSKSGFKDGNQNEFLEDGMDTQKVEAPKEESHVMKGTVISSAATDVPAAGTDARLKDAEATSEVPVKDVAKGFDALADHGQNSVKNTQILSQESITEIRPQEDFSSVSPISPITLLPDFSSVSNRNAAKTKTIIPRKLKLNLKSRAQEKSTEYRTGNRRRIPTRVKGYRRKIPSISPSIRYTDLGVEFKPTDFPCHADYHNDRQGDGQDRVGDGQAHLADYEYHLEDLERRPQNLRMNIDPSTEGSRSPTIKRRKNKGKSGLFMPYTGRNCNYMPFKGGNCGGNRHRYGNAKHQLNRNREFPQNAEYMDTPIDQILNMQRDRYFGAQDRLKLMQQLYNQAKITVPKNQLGLLEGQIEQLKGVVEATRQELLRMGTPGARRISHRYGSPELRTMSPHPHGFRVGSFDGINAAKGKTGENMAMGDNMGHVQGNTMHPSRNMPTTMKPHMQPHNLGVNVGPNALKNPNQNSSKSDPNSSSVKNNKQQVVRDDFVRSFDLVRGSKTKTKDVLVKDKEAFKNRREKSTLSPSRKAKHMNLFGEPIQQSSPSGESSSSVEKRDDSSTGKREVPPTWSANESLMGHRKVSFSQKQHDSTIKFSSEASSSEESEASDSYENPRSLIKVERPLVKVEKVEVEKPARMENEDPRLQASTTLVNQLKSLVSPRSMFEPGLLSDPFKMFTPSLLFQPLSFISEGCHAMLRGGNSIQHRGVHNGQNSKEREGGVNVAGDVTGADAFPNDRKKAVHLPFPKHNHGVPKHGVSDIHAALFNLHHKIAERHPGSRAAVSVLPPPPLAAELEDHDPSDESPKAPVMQIQNPFMETLMANMSKSLIETLKPRFTTTPSSGTPTPRGNKLSTLTVGTRLPVDIGVATTETEVNPAEAAGASAGFAATGVSTAVSVPREGFARTATNSGVTPVQLQYGRAGSVDEVEIPDEGRHHDVSDHASGHDHFHLESHIESKGLDFSGMQQIPVDTTVYSRGRADPQFTAPLSMSGITNKLNGIGSSMPSNTKVANSMANNIDNSALPNLKTLGSVSTEFIDLAELFDNSASGHSKSHDDFTELDKTHTELDEKHKPMIGKHKNLRASIITVSNDEGLKKSTAPKMSAKSMSFLDGTSTIDEKGSIQMHGQKCMGSRQGQGSTGSLQRQMGSTSSLQGQTGPMHDQRSAATLRVSGQSATSSYPGPATSSYPASETSSMNPGGSFSMGKHPAGMRSREYSPGGHNAGRHPRGPRGGYPHAVYRYGYPHAVYRYG